MIDFPQTLEEARAYRYGLWAGNPDSTAYREEQCAYEVQDSNSWLLGQCSRKNGHGLADLYCKQHAKMVTKQIERRKARVK